MQIKTVLAVLLCAVCLNPVWADTPAAETYSYRIDPEIRHEAPAALALLERADRLAQQGQYKQALKLYRQGTKQYFRMPLFFMRLGKMYFSGTGVKKDAKQAYDWLYRAKTAMGAYADPYGIRYLPVHEELNLVYGQAAKEAGEFLNSVFIHSKLAMQGNKQAYAELPDTLRRMYAEHIRPISPSGKTEWQDRTLQWLQQRGSPIADKNGNRYSSWYRMMINFPNWKTANPNLIAYDDAWRLSLAYQHGIGVPQNRVAAQALRLYARSTWLTGREEGSPELHFWLLDDLSAAEQAEAERLAAEWLALSKPSDKMPVDETQPSAVLRSLREYVKKH